MCLSFTKEALYESKAILLYRYLYALKVQCVPQTSGVNMMLKPNYAWKWYFDAEMTSLMLDLGQNMVFQVGIQQKHLIPDAFTEASFNVDDAALFQTFIEAIQPLSLSSARKTELALNAVAAHRFHKPLLPKSWFFHTQEDAFSPETGSLIELTNDFGKGYFIVIENAGTASLCMLAEEKPFKLTETKEMVFCESIKSMNDRFSLLTEEKVYKNGHFAMVG